MITGLSPSVLRSAAMLSLPVVGRSMDRPVGMLNVIAASLIGILAAEPGLLTDVGFQLSYLAVGGIILFYKPIYDLYVTSAWLPDKVWSIISVSIAAQLATFPLTLYLFHQFPNYFILTNILVVPLSGFIIYAGIIVLATSPLPVVSALLAKGLAGLVWLMNRTIHLMDQIPGSVTGGIYISLTATLLLYGVMVTLFLFLRIRKRWLLRMSLALMVLLGILYLHSVLHQRRAVTLTVYNSGGSSLMMFAEGSRGVVIYGSSRRRNPLSDRRILQPALDDAVAAGVRGIRLYSLAVPRTNVCPAGSFLSLKQRGGVFEFSGTRVVVLDRAVPLRLTSRLKAGILIISGNPPVRAEEAIRAFSPAVIVVDAANSRYKARQWRERAEKLHVKCHVVADDGAFVKEF